MKVIVTMGHPAHVHLFKNFIIKFTAKGNIVKVVITDKDILKMLLDENNIEFEVIASRKENETLFDKGLKVFRSSIVLNKILKEFKPDLLIGSLSQMPYASLLKRIPTLFFGEDDITYTFLQGITTYPFISYIIAPNVTKVGFFKYKKISYQGFQKLAYLHPNVFSPDNSCIKDIDTTKPFFLIRLANLSAYHDIKVGGFSKVVLDTVIDKLSNLGTIYITSENKLNEMYQQYLLPVKVKDIHHVVNFADLYIGDSQSMAVEAAMLGTPSIRFNDFAGKISVLEKLEHKYSLTFGIKSTDPEKLYKKIDDLLLMQNRKKEFQLRRQKMLAENIDVTAFMVWLVENYPNSVKIMKDNPDYQWKFK